MQPTRKNNILPPSTSDYLEEQGRQGYDFNMIFFSEAVPRLKPLSKVLEKARKKGPEAFEKKRASIEKMIRGGVAMALPKVNDVKNEGFIIMNKELVDTGSWSSFGLLAHETGHMRDFTRRPGYVKAYKFPFAKSYIETRANIYATKELSRYNAPLSAYKVPLLSEASYLAQDAGFAGMIIGIAGATQKNLKMNRLGMGLMLGGMVGATVAGMKMQSIVKSDIASNKPINKIIGHHPGRMNKVTEAAIDSDFSAGQSWTGGEVAGETGAYNRYKLEQIRINHSDWPDELKQKKLAANLRRWNIEKREAIRRHFVRGRGTVALRTPAGLPATIPIESKWNNWFKNAKRSKLLHWGKWSKWNKAVAWGVGITGAAFALSRAPYGSDDEQPNKIIGHHPGWANKQTEEAIDSDFSAGDSLVLSKAAKKAMKYMTASSRKNRILSKKFSRLISQSQKLSTKDFAKKVGAHQLTAAERKVLIKELPKSFAENLAKDPKFKHLTKAQIRQSEEMFPELAKAFTAGFSTGTKGLTPGMDYMFKKGLLSPNSIYYSPQGLSETLGQLGLSDKNLSKAIKSTILHEAFERETVKMFGASKQFGTHYGRDLLFAESYAFGQSGQKELFNAFKNLRNIDAIQNIAMQPGMKKFGKMSESIGLMKNYEKYQKMGASSGLSYEQVYSKKVREGLMKKAGYGTAATAGGLYVLPKITGHHPGKMNKETEEAIDSDFTAGESWTHIKDALKVMGISTGSGSKSIARGLKEWTKTSNRQIISNLKKSGINVIRVSDDIAAGFDKGTRVLKYNPARIRRDALKLGLSPNKELKMAFMHESLEASASMPGARRAIRPFKAFESSLRKELVDLDDLIERGSFIADSRFASTQKRIDVLSRLRNISDWSHEDIGVLTGEIRASRALGLDYSGYYNKYRSTASMRRAYDRATSGIDISNKMGYKIIAKEGSFIKGYEKIAEIGRRTTAQTNFIKATRNKNTAGLTNKVLHEKRTQHQVMDVTEKTKHLFNI